ncbi:ammonium transporter [Suttonella ornithocola]|uniref:Ammonium transporter n=1 Tax=Suttonella ornithocola TaxID=279832 RepID=A0A380MYY2_9GAMM|nr:ammonium transporter [Suttonella ornithocola]SUO97424.1 Ammonia transporter [Suttonella ornithocola]
MQTDILSLNYALNTFYLLVSAALVLWMAAGFAMLESGLVRSKNTTEILIKNIGLFCIACLMYYLSGYAMMYPGEQYAGGVFPGWHFLVSMDDYTVADLATENMAGDYSRLADFFFQVCFVATAMSVVSGAIAERMKLWAFFIFAIVMCGIIYPIQGFWKWGGGFLDAIGFVDFAGSGIVHLCGASAALAGVLVLGPRMGKYGKHGQIHAIPGANMPLVALGTMILWLGWLGFNSGSQLKISDVENANAVARIFANTTLAATAGGILAMITAQFIFKKMDLTMLCNGVLAGLVAITAAPDSPTLMQAIFIGGVAWGLVVLSVLMIDRFRLDDPVGAISVHGVCGIWGLLAVCLSQENVFVAQLTGIAAIIGFVFITSLMVWFLLKLTIGIRVDAQIEYEGMDLHECGMSAYPEFVGAK